MRTLQDFVKNRRKSTGLTQEKFAERAGVGLPIIRKIEQGHEDLNLQKVNQVLAMFGHELAPVNSKEIDKTSIEDSL